MTNKELFELVDVAITIPKDKWWNYYCDNGAQELNRITCHYKQYELQFNEIYHSEGKHIHTVDLTSIILRNGYTWYLQQLGAEHSLEFFAAPNSIIRMGPQDTHWIPRQEKLSLSFCIFELQTRWDEYFQKLPIAKFDSLFEESIKLLRNFRKENNEYTEKQQMLFSWPD